MFRGYELSIPDYLKPTQVIDAKLALLGNAARTLMNNQRIRLHKGTSEVMARVITLDKEHIKPGEQGYVRFKLEKPVVAERKERYVIRSYSPMRVIGGGRFLEPYAFQKRRLVRRDLAAYLRSLEETRDRDLVETIILHAEHPITDEKELMRMTNLPLDRVIADLKRLVEKGTVLKMKDSTIVHATTVADLKERSLRALEQYIEKNPLKVVMSKSELAKAVRISRPAVLERVLEELSEQGLVDVRTDGIRKTGVEAKLSADAQKLSDAIEQYVTNTGFKPFRFIDITEAFPKISKGRINVFDYLYKNNCFTEIADGTYLHKQVLERAKKRLLEHLMAKQTIRAIEYKEVLGVSRNTARDILDYFFDHGVTVREKGTHRLVD
jgi:selenocysteine-specific elongation factor